MLNIALYLIFSLHGASPNCHGYESFLHSNPFDSVSTSTKSVAFSEIVISFDRWNIRTYKNGLMIALSDAKSKHCLDSSDEIISNLISHENGLAAIDTLKTKEISQNLGELLAISIIRHGACFSYKGKFDCLDYSISYHPQDWFLTIFRLKNSWEPVFSVIRAFPENNRDHDGDF